MFSDGAHKRSGSKALHARNRGKKSPKEKKNDKKFNTPTKKTGKSTKKNVKNFKSKKNIKRRKNSILEEEEKKANWPDPGN